MGRRSSGRSFRADVTRQVKFERTFVSSLDSERILFRVVDLNLFTNDGLDLLNSFAVINEERLHGAVDQLHLHHTVLLFVLQIRLFVQ